MGCSKYILCLLLYGNLYTILFAQHNGSAKNTVALFEDLPIDDASARSVLLAGENGEKKIRDNIFAKASLNKQSCFPGESLLLHYELYTALQSTSEIIKQPELSGFVSYPVMVNNEAILYKKMNGKKYRVYRLLAFQIIPYQAGLINIAPLHISNTVIYEDKNTHTKTFSGQITTKALRVFVDELPASGKPGLFAGVTGNYRITTNIRLLDNPAGESNSLFITIEGAGSFMNIELPAIQWPKGFEHFPEKEHTSVNYNVFPATGKKIYEIPFVAAKAGKFSIAPVSLAYFDPGKKEYRIVQSDTIALNISSAVMKPVKKTSPIKDGAVLKSLAAVIILLVVCIGSIIFLRRKKN